MCAVAASAAANWGRTEFDRPHAPVSDADQPSPEREACTYGWSAADVRLVAREGGARVMALATRAPGGRA